MKKVFLVVCCTLGVLFSLFGVNTQLVASDVETSVVSHKTGNYTIDKIVSDLKGEEFFTKDYADEMFESMNVSDDTKVIADEEGGLFYSIYDNHAVLKTYDTETGQVIEELSLDSPEATTIGELKKAVYAALEE